VKTAAIVNYEKYAAHPQVALAVPKKPVKQAKTIAPKAKAKSVAHRAAAKPKAKPAAIATKKNSGGHPTAASVVTKASVTKPIFGPPKPPNSAPAVKTLQPVTSKAALANPANGSHDAGGTRAGMPAPHATVPVAATSQKKPSAGIPKEASSQ